MCISRLKFCCEIQFFFHQSYEHTEGNNYNTEPFGTAIQLWSPLWYDIEICTINIWLLRNIRLNVICDKVVLTKIIAYQLVVDMVTMQPIDYYSEQAGAPKGVAFHKSVLNSQMIMCGRKFNTQVSGFCDWEPQGALRYYYCEDKLSHTCCL